jgi:hypothetical protein
MVYNLDGTGCPCHAERRKEFQKGHVQQVCNGNNAFDGQERLCNVHFPGRLRKRKDGKPLVSWAFIVVLLIVAYLMEER